LLSKNIKLHTHTHTHTQLSCLHEGSCYKLLLQVCLIFDGYFPLVRKCAEAYIDLAGIKSWKKTALCFLLFFLNAAD